MLIDIKKPVVMTGFLFFKQQIISNYASLLSTLLKK